MYKGSSKFQVQKLITPELNKNCWALLMFGLLRLDLVSIIQDSL